MKPTDIKDTPIDLPNDPALKTAYLEKQEAEVVQPHQHSILWDGPKLPGKIKDVVEDLRENQPKIKAYPENPPTDKKAWNQNFVFETKKAEHDSELLKEEAYKALPYEQGKKEIQRERLAKLAGEKLNPPAKEKSLSSQKREKDREEYLAKQREAKERRNKRFTRGLTAGITGAAIGITAFLGRGTGKAQKPHHNQPEFTGAFVDTKIADGMLSMHRGELDEGAGKITISPVDIVKKEEPTPPVPETEIKNKAAAKKQVVKENTADSDPKQVSGKGNKTGLTEKLAGPKNPKGGGFGGGTGRNTPGRGNQAINGIPLSKELRFTLNWEGVNRPDYVGGPADLDLHIIEPSGKEVYHGNVNGGEIVRLVADNVGNEKLAGGPEIIQLREGVNLEPGTQLQAFVTYRSSYVDRPNPITYELQIWNNGKLEKPIREVLSAPGDTGTSFDITVRKPLVPKKVEAEEEAGDKGAWRERNKKNWQTNESDHKAHNTRLTSKTNDNNFRRG
jgi:hypothetical protein